MLAQSIGDNRKGIIVIFRLTGDQNPPDLLLKILQSVGITATQDALLLPFTAESTYSVTTLSQLTDVKDVLSFGVMPESLGLHWQPQAYTPLIVAGRRYLFGHGIDYFQDPKHKSAKVKLWRALQTMYPTQS